MGAPYDLIRLFDGVAVEQVLASKVIDCRAAQQVSIHHRWTSGDSVGSFVYEMTNDPLAADPATAGSASWLDVTSVVSPVYGDASIAAAAAGQQGVVLREPMRWLRMRVDHTGGTTTLLTTDVHTRRI